MLSLFLFLLVDFVVAFLSPLSAVAAVVATGWLLSLLPLLVDCCCFCYCRFVIAAAVASFLPVDSSILFAVPLCLIQAVQYAMATTVGSLALAMQTIRILV